MFASSSPVVRASSELFDVRLPRMSGSSFIFPEGFFFFFALFRLFMAFAGASVRFLAFNFPNFARAEHERFALYVERFCSLFRADVFLPKLFQRIVDAGLVDLLPTPAGVDDVRYHLWEMDSDNFSGSFRVDRAIEMFQQIGVVKRGNSVSNAGFADNLVMRIMAIVLVLVWLVIWMFR
jgi:hypothetical protein